MNPLDQQFVPHRVVWTRDKSRRWWDESTSRAGFHERYFSRIMGGTLLRCLASWGVSLEGRVLDFGCGPGYLLEKLAAKGVDCHGLEFAPESVSKAQARLQAAGGSGTVALARGIPTHLPTSSFDVVFFLETLEHLLEDDRAPTVAELGRIVRPGGTVIVTVPNREDLERAQVLCPDCGCQFHPMQHVSRWDSTSLATIMGEHGFTTVKTKELVLHRNWMMGQVRTVASAVLGRTLPNLVYVGRQTRR